MSVEESYIRVFLKDNTVLDFDKKCTHVVATGDKFCKFTNENDRVRSLLALIPYENILYIDNYPYKEASSYE